MNPQIVKLSSGSFQLTGKFFAPDQSSGNPLPGLVYCCGFPGSERSFMIAKALSDGGYSVLALNYRGIRESEGEVDFASQVDDVRAGLSYLETRMEVDRELISIAGHSAGGALAILTAAQDLRVKAVAVWGAVGNYERFLKFLLSPHGNFMMRLDNWLTAFLTCSSTMIFTSHSSWVLLFIAPLLGAHVFGKRGTRVGQKAVQRF